MLVFIKNVVPNLAYSTGKELPRGDNTRLDPDHQRKRLFTQQSNGKTPLIFTTVKELKGKYSNIFNKKYGEIKDEEVDLILKENIKLIFCKAHNVLFALRSTVEAELDNLQKNNIVYPDTQPEWATLIVVVPKENG